MPFYRIALAKIMPIRKYANLIVQKTKYLLFIILILPSTVYSQKSNNGNWFIYFGNQKINKYWNFHNEIQYRNYNAIGDLQQFVLRTGIGFDLSENNNNILLGYGFFHSQNYMPDSENKSSMNEHRIFQQFITKQSFNRLHLQHRYRIEERIFSNDFQIRFRYFLGVNIPINKEQMLPKTLYASAYNEIFINSQDPIFDRNRLYGAVGYVINENFKLEIGYMAQTTQDNNRNQFQIVFFNNLPFN